MVQQKKADIKCFNNHVIIATCYKNQPATLESNWFMLWIFNCLTHKPQTTKCPTVSILEGLFYNCFRKLINKSMMSFKVRTVWVERLLDLSVLRSNPRSSEWPLLDRKPTCSVWIFLCQNTQWWNCNNILRKMTWWHLGCFYELNENAHICINKVQILLNILNTYFE